MSCLLSKRFRPAQTREFLWFQDESTIALPHPLKMDLRPAGCASFCSASSLHATLKIPVRPLLIAKNRSSLTYIIVGYWRCISRVLGTTCQSFSVLSTKRCLVRQPVRPPRIPTRRKRNRNRVFCRNMCFAPVSGNAVGGSSRCTGRKGEAGQLGGQAGGSVARLLKVPQA